MILGAMNNPYKSLLPQIGRFGELGLGFLDLTAEWPEASPEKLLRSERKIKDALSTAGLSVVGHTPWFLPYANPCAGVRKESIAEINRSFEALARFGAKTMTVHPDITYFAYKNRDQFLSHFFQSIGELDERARSFGATMVFEPFDENALSTEELGEMVKRFPKVGLHIDIGHANLDSQKGARFFKMLKLFGKKLKHVHASDNDGKSDQHLPIGTGKIKWLEICKALKKAGYNRTITLEIFSQDTEYLEISKRKFEEIWKKA